MIALPDTIICANCGTNCPHVIGLYELNRRGKEYKGPWHHYECPQCGEFWTTKEADTENMRIAGGKFEQAAKHMERVQKQKS